MWPVNIHWSSDTFLDAFAKLRKATISFVMSLSVRSHVRPRGTTGLPLDGF